MNMQGLQKMMPADEFLRGVAGFLAHEREVQSGAGIVVEECRPRSGSAEEVANAGAVSLQEHDVFGT
jgi:hypothetical protein